MMKHICAFAVLFLVMTDSAFSASVKIATLGTSLTENGGWQGTVQDGLASCAGQPVEVLNFGKGGAGSEWGIEVLPKIIASKPQAVVIEFAINDADRSHGAPLGVSISRINQVLDGISEGLPNAKSYLMITNWPWGYQAGRRPLLYKYFNSYRTIAAERKVGLIDTEKSWLSVTFRDIGDGLHPSKATMKSVLAPRIIESLSDQFCRGK